MDHFVGILKEVRRDSKETKEQEAEAEAKVSQASKRVDEALAAKAVVEEEVRSLKAKVKTLEAKVTKAWSDAGARLSEDLSIAAGQWEKKLVSEKVAAVEAFRFLDNF